MMRSARMLGVSIVVAIAWVLTLLGQSAQQPRTATGQSEAASGFDDETIETAADPMSVQHHKDLAFFDEIEHKTPDGLGPVYNAQSCRECHQDPVSGAASQVLEQRAGHLTADGRFQNPAVPIEGDTITGRNLINDRAICQQAQEVVPSSETIHTNRLSLNILGDGFVESLTDQTILDVRDTQCQSKEGLGICGMAVFVPILEAPPTTLGVGRFGWKSQHASLLSFAADAYLNEMGITNRLQRDELTTICNPTIRTPTDPPTANTITEPNSLPDPADGNREDIDHFASFMRATKVPPRDASKDSDIVKRGAIVFAEVRCNECHRTDMVTPAAGTVIHAGQPPVTAALGNKVFHPLSDFLLHNVGTGDGIPIAPVEHYGEPMGTALNQLDAVRVGAPNAIVDPLAIGRSHSGTADAMASRGAFFVRPISAHDACDAKVRWQEDKRPTTMGAVYGMMQCTANRMRTPPLWGLHMRTRLMHDGQSIKLEDAILRHKEEAGKVIEKFNALTPADRNALMAFLRSL